MGRNLLEAEEAREEEAGGKEAKKQRSKEAGGKENSCCFVSVNYASAGSPTTLVVVRPGGTVQCYQPYGREGLLVADVDLDAAAGFGRRGANIHQNELSFLLSR